MAGRWSIGAWLMAIGLTLGIVGGGGLALLRISGVSLFVEAPEPSPLVALLLLASVLLLGAAGLIFVIGLALYVIVPALDTNAARQGYGSHATVLASLGLAVVVSLVAQSAALMGFALAEPGAQANGFAISVTRGSQQMLAPIGLVVAVVSLELSLLGVLWVRIVHPGAITWDRMGITNRHLGRNILYGLGTGVVIFFVAAVVGLVLQQFGFEQTQMELFKSIRGASPLEFALVLLAGGLLAGFAEEAFFRGYVFQAYQEQKGTWQAYLFSALIFGVVHLFSLDLRAFLPTFVAIFAIGLVLAYVYNKTHSVIPTAIGHAVNNSIAFAALYFAM